MSESMLTAAFIILSGGLQDAYTYLCRGKVFANAQTGNIVLFSAYLFDGDWAHSRRYLVPVLSFMLGIFVAECIHRHFKHMERVHWRQLILLAEGRSSCLQCRGFHLGLYSCFHRFFHILLTTADIANAVVVDLHGLGRVFRPLYLFLVNHDLLNEQPQQLRRQLRDICVPLRLIKEAVRPAHRFPQTGFHSLSVGFRL